MRVFLINVALLALVLFGLSKLEKKYEQYQRLTHPCGHHRIYTQYKVDPPKWKCEVAK